MKNFRMSGMIEILLVEDNPGDTRLVLDAFKDYKILNRISTVEDGVEAMAFLRKAGKYADKPRPDIILLDLNLPKKDGREVLAEIKDDPDFKKIPVVVLTTSDLEKDIAASYEKHANCYLTKPVDFKDFLEVMKHLETFG